MVTAWQYVRFSSERQEEGDSIRRQIEAGKAWSKRTDTPLPEANIFADYGVSGFTGKHRKGDSKLAELLGMVERGRIPPGDTLLIENLDRLTREEPVTAINLITNVLMKGVILVALEPRETTYTSTTDIPGLLLMMLEVGRANAESARKSKMVGAAWRRKKAAARDGVILSRRLPAWVQIVDGKLALIPDRAATVKRIFDLSIAGYGIPSIAKKLAKEGVAPFGGRAEHWTRAYLAVILKDKRATGEYQPRSGKDCDGAAIADYYPAVVTLEEYHEARASAKQRGTRSGRTSTRQVNIFAKLLFNARDGDTYMVTQRFSKNPNRPPRRYSSLVNRAGDECRGRCYSIPYLPLEAAFLSLLREINPAEVLGEESGSNDLRTLSSELTSIETELSEATAYMDEHGFSPTIGKRITALEVRKDEVAVRLVVARQQAASPLSEVWGETQSLAAALASAADPHDARLRLRTALRRIVDKIYMLIVRRGQVCLAALQVWFMGGERHRDYLVHYMPARRPGGSKTVDAQWSARSLSQEHAKGGLDLRDQSHAARLEKVLRELPLRGPNAYKPEHP